MNVKHTLLFVSWLTQGMIKAPIRAVKNWYTMYRDSIIDEPFMSGLILTMLYSMCAAFGCLLPVLFKSPDLQGSFTALIIWESVIWLHYLIFLVATMYQRFEDEQQELLEKLKDYK